MINEEPTNAWLTEANKHIGSAVLRKATCDPFSYCLTLRSGRTIHFEQAIPLGTEWVHLVTQSQGGANLPPMHERGMDVRLSEIESVVDAPNGS